MRGPGRYYTDTKAFKDWFGDSKVVDAEVSRWWFLSRNESGLRPYSSAPAGRVRPSHHLTDNPREGG